MLRQTLLGPLEPWRRFELAVGLSAAEELALAQRQKLLNVAPCLGRFFFTGHLGPARAAGPLLFGAAGRGACCPAA
jgi:hypothetical protein